jgi:hypothetical protein
LIDVLACCHHVTGRAIPEPTRQRQRVGRLFAEIGGSFLQKLVSNLRMGELQCLFQTPMPIHELVPIDQFVEFVLAEVVGTSQGSDALTNNLLLSSF